MSMSDDVAGAALQVSTQAAETAISAAGNVVNRTIDNIAKLLQALAAKREAKYRDNSVSSTELKDLKPGEVSVSDLRQNAVNNRENIAFSENGFTAADRKELLQKAKSYGMPIAFMHEKGKDNYYGSVRSSDLPVFKKICTELMQDKLAERPQELGNFKVQEWEIPFITKELNKYDLSAQFGRTNNNEHFCLFEKDQEKTMLIARGLFVSKCKEINENIALEHEDNGYYTIKDNRSGKEISFDDIPSHDNLAQTISAKFGYNDIGKAELVCAKFGEEMLEGSIKKRFFNKNIQNEFSSIEANVELKGESILVKPYSCWHITPKTDEVPKIVYRDDTGRFAVLEPGNETRKAMTKAIKNGLGLSDDKTITALIDKAMKLNNYYSKKADENYSYNMMFSENDFESLADSKELPLESMECEIDRADKDSFILNTTFNSGDNTNRQELKLSFSDKKNALSEITEMLKKQGVPESSVLQIAKECFRRAKNQSPEKVVQLEEIRGNKPYYGVNSELHMDFKCGNRKETLNVSEPEKAKKELIDKFAVTETAAAAAMDKVDIMITQREHAVLNKFGFKDLDKWTNDEAAEIIDKIESNGWKVPSFIDPDTYKPGDIDFKSIDISSPKIELPDKELPKMPVIAGRSK